MPITFLVYSIVSTAATAAAVAVKEMCREACQGQKGARTRALAKRGTHTCAGLKAGPSVPH